MKSNMQPKAWGFATLALLASLTLLPGCNRQDTPESPTESAANTAHQPSASGDKDHAAEENEDADHDGHGEEHDEHGEETVRLSEAEIREFGLELTTAAAGTLDQGRRWDPGPVCRAAR